METRGEHAGGQAAPAAWPTVADGLQDGLLLLEASGRIVRANRRAGELVGLAAEHLCGRGLPELFGGPEARPGAAMARALHASQAASLEAPMCTADGRWVQVHVQLSPLGTDAGRSGAWAVLRRVAAPEPAIEVDPTAQAERLAHLATHDELTGLLNRRCLREVLTREFARARRYGAPLSFIMIDLDFFKAINDRHGHLVGDEVLRTTAQLLRQCLRHPDVAFRYGGEELGVLLPNTDLSGAIALAERVRRHVEAHPFTARGRPLPVTVSLGVASLDALTAQAEDLIARADAALYEAKARGRNFVCAWGHAQAAASRRLVAGSSVAAQANARLSALVQAQRASALACLAALAADLEPREGYDGTHAAAVAGLAVAMARRAGLHEPEIADIRGAALLHDLGKLAIPESILGRPGPLTPAQRQVLQQYPLMGEQILRQVKHLEREALLVRWHNEWFDGSHGLQTLCREALPLGARIIALAEAFRALVSDRPYRRRRRLAEAMREIDSLAGRRFDPALCDLLAELVGQGRATVTGRTRLRVFDPLARSA